MNRFPCRFRHRRSLTLLEIILVMVLLSFLLTGLFNIFYQASKNNIESKRLKQTILPFELFEQQIKHIVSQSKKISTITHPEATGKALFIQWSTKADNDWNHGIDLEGMLYLNADKQLCFANWATNGNMRHCVLLDQIDRLNCQFFDPHKKVWKDDWASQSADMPAMLRLDLQRQEQSIPFVFFPPCPKPQISYYGIP